MNRTISPIIQDLCMKYNKIPEHILSFEIRGANIFIFASSTDNLLDNDYKGRFLMYIVKLSMAGIYIEIKKEKFFPADISAFMAYEGNALIQDIIESLVHIITDIITNKFRKEEFTDGGDEEGRV